LAAPLRAVCFQIEGRCADFKILARRLQQALIKIKAAGSSTSTAMWQLRQSTGHGARASIGWCASASMR
jgi:hypothetical protein